MQTNRSAFLQYCQPTVSNIRRSRPLDVETWLLVTATHSVLLCKAELALYTLNVLFDETVYSYCVQCSDENLVSIILTLLSVYM